MAPISSAMARLDRKHTRAPRSVPSQSREPKLSVEGPLTAARSGHPWASRGMSRKRRSHLFPKRSANDCSLRILFSNGSRGERLFGCLRSLRARSALDGVSWVQGGSVEIAVSRWLACVFFFIFNCSRRLSSLGFFFFFFFFFVLLGSYRIGAIVCSLLGRRPLLPFSPPSPWNLEGLRSIRTPSHLAASHA